MFVLPSSSTGILFRSRLVKSGLISKVVSSGLGHPYAFTRDLRDVAVDEHLSSESATPSLSESVFILRLVLPNEEELNVALTVLIPDIVTLQVVVVPEHAPDQPVKVEPCTGVAVKVTDVPELYASAQSVPQEIPVPVIVPLPDPDLITVVVRV